MAVQEMSQLLQTPKQAESNPLPYEVITGLGMMEGLSLGDVGH
jgi:hypothetical protein